nr:immunoglobulin heavy chain junction region [Mus musculus]MBK4198584.1 immunoglobulin heavy chain junction region [Mus musculus]
CTPTGYYFDYW